MIWQKGQNVSCEDKRAYLKFILKTKMYCDLFYLKSLFLALLTVIFFQLIICLIQVSINFIN